MPHLDLEGRRRRSREGIRVSVAGVFRSETLFDFTSFLHVRMWSVLGVQLGPLEVHPGDLEPGEAF